MNNLNIEQCKAIAQAEAKGADFLVHCGKVWDISEGEAKALALEWVEEKLGERRLSEEHLMEWLEETQYELEYNEDGDYIVLTDSEADEKAEEYIEDTLWAFNAGFLSEVTGFDVSIFEAVQSNGKCEDNNGAILQLVGDNIGLLVQDAISSDGRGHFLNTYDGEETEFNCKDYTGNNECLFVYRIN